MGRHDGVPVEAQEQEWLMSWAALRAAAHPELRLLYHIPNGGKRTKTEARRFCAQGVKPGVPDLCLPVARRGYHGLYIELKRRKGGRVSAAQRDWLCYLGEQGYFAVTCSGWQAAAETICRYLGIKWEAVGNGNA